MVCAQVYTQTHLTYRRYIYQLIKKDLCRVVNDDVTTIEIVAKIKPPLIIAFVFQKF